MSMPTRRGWSGSRATSTPTNFPGHWVRQQYLPNELKDRKYYQYGDNKTEQAARRLLGGDQEIGDRLQRALLRPKAPRADSIRPRGLYWKGRTFVCRESQRSVTTRVWISLEPEPPLRTYRV